MPQTRKVWGAELQLLAATQISARLAREPLCFLTMILTTGILRWGSLSRAILPIPNFLLKHPKDGKIHFHRAPHFSKKSIFTEIFRIVIHSFSVVRSPVLHFHSLSKYNYSSLHFFILTCPYKSHLDWKSTSIELRAFFLYRYSQYS